MVYASCNHFARNRFRFHESRCQPSRETSPSTLRGAQAPPECPLINSLRSLCESPDTPGQTPRTTYRWVNH
jgi:hypothetical protein